MTFPTPETLDTIEKLHKAATPGEWFAERDCHWAAEDLIDYAHAGDATEPLFDTCYSSIREIHEEPDDEGGVSYHDKIGSANIAEVVALHNATLELVAAGRFALKARELLESLSMITEDTRVCPFCTYTYTFGDDGTGGSMRQYSHGGDCELTALLAELTQ